MFKQILLVGIGGGLGSILRFMTSVLTEKYNTTIFPLATFKVNILGCLFVGLLIGLLGQSVQESQNLKLIFITGFCGGYTTYSAFATESLTLIQDHNYGTAVLYMITSILAGILAVWIGFTIAK